MANVLDEVIGLPEAEELVGISEEMLRRYCERGDLPARRLRCGWVTTIRAVKKFRPRRRGRPSAD